MSDIRQDLLYTKDHEWVRKTANAKVVRVGITDFAQAALGDVTFIQLPEPGKTFQRGEVFGTVESVKAVSDLYAPVSGTIVSINEDLVNDPSPVNTAPFDAAWMVEIEVSTETELTELLSAGAYTALAQ